MPLRRSRLIESCGNQRWRVSIPSGRDPATGKLVNHYKSVRGSKKDAQAYVDWAAGLLAAGQTAIVTVSQSELRMLAALQAKADQFKKSLQDAVRAGAKVEPGLLNPFNAGEHLGSGRREAAKQQSPAEASRI